MRYFYDTEFHERGPGHPIELISIGIVSENGRELYLINSDFDWDDPKHTDSPSIEWLRENVKPHVIGTQLDSYGVPFAEIKSRLLRFVDRTAELWAYYAAYDHVVFAQVFGTMAQLPFKSWMHTMDLRQVIRSMHLSKESLPQQQNEHLAIDDARWNKRVWEYIFLGNGPLSQDTPFIEDDRG